VGWAKESCSEEPAACEDFRTFGSCNIFASPKPPKCGENASRAFALAAIRFHVSLAFAVASNSFPVERGEYQCELRLF